MGAIAGGWSLNGIWSFQSGPHWSPYVRLTGATLVEPGTGTPSWPRTSAAAIASTPARNGHSMANSQGVDKTGQQCPELQTQSFYVGARLAGKYSGRFQLLERQRPASARLPDSPLSPLRVWRVLGILDATLSSVPGQWTADMTLAKVFKLTERFNLKFEAAAFNIFQPGELILSNGSASASTTASTIHYLAKRAERSTRAICRSD